MCINNLSKLALPLHTFGQDDRLALSCKILIHKIKSGGKRAVHRDDFCLKIQLAPSCSGYNSTEPFFWQWSACYGSFPLARLTGDRVEFTAKVAIDHLTRWGWSFMGYKPSRRHVSSASLLHECTLNDRTTLAFSLCCSSVKKTKIPCRIYRHCSCVPTKALTKSFSIASWL